jgi:hypothetical protein
MDSTSSPASSTRTGKSRSSEEIRDAAAHGHVARSLTWNSGWIAECDEFSPEVLEVEALAERKRKAKGGELAAEKRPLPSRPEPMR